MPEPGGLALAQVGAILEAARARAPILGAGFTAFLPEERNVPALSYLAAAASF
jgi:hypothetical protein